MSTLLTRIGNDMEERANAGRKAPSVAIVHPVEFWAFVHETAARVLYSFDDEREYVTVETKAGPVVVTPDPDAPRGDVPHYLERP